MKDANSYSMQLFQSSTVFKNDIYKNGEFTGHTDLINQKVD